MQVKIITCDDLEQMEQSLNQFLKGISNEPQSIKYDFSSNTAVVEYTEVNDKSICCECRFWDDSGSKDSLIGRCQMCGSIKRFSSRSCNKYEDIRE